MIESQPYLSNRALRTPRAAAIAAGIPDIYALNPGLLIENSVYAIARAIAYRSNPAWMFVFVLTTNWVPTQVLPRWLALVSYALTLALLVSVNILILNYRQQDEITIKDGLMLDD